METLKNPTLTKAIKEHKCSFCNGLIREGEKYMHSTHIYDGIYAWKSHLNCDYIANRLDMYKYATDCGYEGLTGSMFVELISEEYYTLISDKIKPFRDFLNDVSDTILGEIQKVAFYSKLSFVIRHYKKMDSETLKNN